MQKANNFSHNGSSRGSDRGSNRGSKIHSRGERLEKTKHKCRFYDRFLPPLAILIVGAILFCWLASIEAPIVEALSQKPWVYFEKIMGRSLYEGGAFGGSDIGVTSAIICFLVWTARRGANSDLLGFSRQELKFVWVASLSVSLVFVHSLKTIVSRARPKIYFGNTSEWAIQNINLSSMDWPGFLPISGPRGYGWNSFPSGHTACAAVLLCFAYIFYRKSRALGLGFGIAVFFYSVAMSIARSMGGMHWLSDSAASFFGAWAIIHEISVRMKIHSMK
jgi:membrane-associated phospholipid phosphatase